VRALAREGVNGGATHAGRGAGDDRDPSKISLLESLRPSQAVFAQASWPALAGLERPGGYMQKCRHKAGTFR
jgi:hypothetical protein